MTIRQFLKRLESERGRKWRVSKDGKIRSGGMCPISSLLSTSDSEWSWVAHHYGISHKDSMRIVNAADNAFPPIYDRRLRRRILEAVGLRKTV